MVLINEDTCPYSVEFIIDGVSKHTWSDWQMVPDTPPMISFPEPNLNYVEIPGRSGGPLDLTGQPFGKMTYKRITGSWSFLRDPDDSTTRLTLYNELCVFLHGKKGAVILDEQPNYYYTGRFAVGVPSTGTGPIKFTISYDLVPKRYRISNLRPDPNFGYETLQSDEISVTTD